MNAPLWTFTLLASSLAIGNDFPVQREREWIDRPWEIRYVAFFDTKSGFRIGAKVARESNESAKRSGRKTIYFSLDDLLSPKTTYKVPGMGEPIGMALLQFDHDGKITSRSGPLNGYKAKRNSLGDLVLIKTELSTEIPFRLARWSQGIPGDVSFSPAVCSGDDWMRNETDRTDFSNGAFGCREWTAQLYNRERPYIDVTSYASDGNFIGHFVGWSRFADPPKPVIGLHGKTWLCLHECPTGEKPGIIRDIKEWTSKHGFPMPERPPQQPLYPNSKYKADIEEE